MPQRLEITRTVPLLDYEVSRSGDGRTVIAYAATFGNPYEVFDEHGHYDEIINRAAFNAVLNRPGSIDRVQVFYNHDGRWPIGVPEEIKADARGLLTRTRYLRNQKAEDVLEMWREGAIRGQSFIGPILGRDKVTRSGINGRPVIERMALGLKEYGPAPAPINADAELVAIRSQLLDRPWSELSPEERQELIALETEAPSLEPPDHHESHDAATDEAPPVESPAPGLSVDQLIAEQAQRRRRG